MIHVTEENAYVGAKVTRGEKWRWEDQDKGSKFGTITDTNFLRKESKFFTYVTVKWQNNPSSTFYYCLEEKQLSFYDYKPVAPQILGEMHHLEAFLLDMEKLGYSEIDKKYRGSSDSGIRLNAYRFSSTDLIKLKSLAVNLSFKPDYQEKQFHLPEQWKEALNHCKEFLQDDYFEENKKTKIVALNVKATDDNGSDASFAVSITKEKITYRDVEFDVKELENIVKTCSNFPTLTTQNYSVSVPYITIGCKNKISMNDIKEIIKIYKSLQ